MVSGIAWVDTEALLKHPRNPRAESTPRSFLSGTGEFIFLDCFQQVLIALLPEIEGDDKQYQTHWLWLHEANLVEKIRFNLPR